MGKKIATKSPQHNNIKNKLSLEEYLLAMLNFEHDKLIAQFEDFRQQLYNCFESCRDACMDLPILDFRF